MLQRWLTHLTPLVGHGFDLLQLLPAEGQLASKALGVTVLPRAAAAVRPTWRPKRHAPHW